MPNRIDLVVHYLACFKAGLVATPLNYRYTHHEIDHALEVSGAVALLAHVERADDVASSALPRRPCPRNHRLPRRGRRSARQLVTQLRGAVGRGEPLVFDPAPDPSMPAAIFFTSGEHRAGEGSDPLAPSRCGGSSRAPPRHWSSPRRDEFLPGSSMSHIGSFMWALSALSVGAKVVVARSHRRTRAASSVAYEPPDGAGDDPGRAGGAGARSRSSAG